VKDPNAELFTLILSRKQTNRQTKVKA